MVIDSFPGHPFPGSRWTFRPRRVLFEPAALDYDLGRRLWDHFRAVGQVDSPNAGGPPEIRLIPSHNRITGLPGSTPAEAYREAKRTLVVGVRKGLDFATCRPSADFQLPLVTSCPGLCEYCYLQTTLGNRPYVRVYVNVDEVLEEAGRRAREHRADRPLYFEGAAVGDPVPVEPHTGALARAVGFFAGLEGARFRFVTKFPDVDGLLGLEHRGHTRVRVTVNTHRVIGEFDKATPNLDTRLETLRRLAGAGYPIGAMVAPVFLDDGWQDDYEELFHRFGAELPADLAPDLTVEVVTHRFTGRARNVIRERHPRTTLPLNEEGRTLKRGQFGYFKYVYPAGAMAEAKARLAELAGKHLPHASLDYIV